MSKSHSPTRFNGEADNFFDPNFTFDINNRMRVPKSIRVNGDFVEEEDINGLVGSNWSQVLANEKFEMHVPDRILVVGQEQHVGTKAPPREITLENAVLPTVEPGLVRVQTPPRVLTLDDHYFPMADDDIPLNESLEMVSAAPKTNRQYNSENQIVRHVREQTPFNTTLDVTLTPSEEVQHLRRQVGKLHRRIIAVESQITQRQQRDKILYAISITYFFLKALSWLTRN